MELEFNLLSFVLGLAIIPLLHMAAFGTGFAVGYVTTRRLGKGLSDPMPHNGIGAMTGLSLADVYKN
ncbi:hypothetical protein [Thalassospira indica]|uniref:Uncharacterized protein n=1 Tax=Thalassospira indica TaxID=1891279 RepID=A0ABM6Y6G7_9PROT|nr:hypothetical protein [Thalassospira indica]AXO16490.1 hypothetical protein DY252_21325 [Thalassospira indica]OAZ10669.1 hypothetical protein TH15_18970 [Thalassospira profundimaris]